MILSVVKGMHSFGMYPFLKSMFILTFWLLFDKLYIIWNCFDEDK